jgi:hypothetical protein
MTSFSSFIGGGSANTTNGTASDVIAGGRLNKTSSGFQGQSILGGFSNLVCSNWSSVVGGTNNVARNCYGFIGGGCANTISSV